MSKGRMEAFSNGVLAIIITIMVLGLTAPRGTGPAALLAVLPTLISYVLSFVLLGIYWNNHHHLLQAIKHVDGRVLWANLHLLFWLSLILFTTAWMGRTEFAGWPVAVYGLVLTLAAIAYYFLTWSLIALHGADSTLATAGGPGRQRERRPWRSTLPPCSWPSSTRGWRSRCTSSSPSCGSCPTAASRGR